MELILRLIIGFVIVSIIIAVFPGVRAWIDGGDRKHIQVQLPEPTDEKSEAFKKPPALNSPGGFFVLRFESQQIHNVTEE